MTPRNETSSTCTSRGWPCSMTCIKLCQHAAVTQRGPHQVFLHCLQSHCTSEVTVFGSVVGVWITLPGICLHTLRSAASPIFLRLPEYTVICGPLKASRVGRRARLTAKLPVSVIGQTFACTRTSNIWCHATQHIVGKCTATGRHCLQGSVQSCLL